MFEKPLEKGKKEDLRVRRTYKLLLNALTSLLEEKSFEEINVTDICAKAMVHRTTFYKHFNDKYHLLEVGIATLIKNFDQASLMGGNFEYPKQYYMSVIKHALEYLAANKKRSLLVLVTGGSGSLMTTLHKLLAEEIKRKLEENEKKGVVYYVPIRIIAEFHAGALLSLAKWWLENKMSVPEEEMIKYVDLMINGNNYVFTPDSLKIPKT
ncbi:TetR/AcrR family transcriptional regulator [Clostridium formicaceticum]|uniref:Bacterial regulatory protein, tetR family n=1 Tax=Clostridium formicaceticum TaxID=1497 RepID=A0AAC9WG75_9CLOT|nr:TetR-like C-terminal domain-containing protein [Clostridium formicaceticum]AOY77103.1 hypothetical protein BJL90_15350 [Clostridium formicaceticum]ARE87613.1 Bacterial regulatory protein, tetR family [Clostridium formicaceticum]